MKDEPIAIIPKNSSERIQIALAEYENRKYVDVRLHFLPRDGDEWRPTKKGVTLNPRKLPDLIAALQQAEAAARDADHGLRIPDRRSALWCGICSE